MLTGIKIRVQFDRQTHIIIVHCTECPADFTYVSLVNGCYKVVNRNLAWTAAGLECRSLHKDAHLLIINDAVEQSAIAGMLASIDGPCKRSPSSSGFSRSYCYTVQPAIGISMSSVCPSVCNAVYCGSQGRCTGPKIVPACSWQACSNLSVQTLLLQPVSFSHKTHEKKTIEENANVSFLPRDALVHSAVLRLHVVRLSVRPSVRLSVRLSVTLVDQDHIGCKSWKLIARSIRPTPLLFVAQRPST